MGSLRKKKHGIPIKGSGYRRGEREREKLSEGKKERLKVEWERERKKQMRNE